MSNKRPNIGVTGPDEGGRAAWWFTKFALFVHGARPIRISPESGIPEEDIHGLVIGGGADIHPKRYSDKEIEDLLSEDEQVSGIRQLLIRLATIFFFPIIYLIRKLFSTSIPVVDTRRDELEFEVLEQALEKGIPILGICRGAQLLNIHFGGTLFSDIDNYYTEVPRVQTVWPKKKVSIKSSSKLQEILTHSEIWVNALHHQAVDKLGDGLQVVAREESGIVQALEHETHEFLLGVQWHPEYMPQIPPQREIFKALVDQARKFVNGRSKN